MAGNLVDYDTDFYAWTIEQSRLLRAGELSAVDAANIAEEIESMGRSDRRELQSRLVVLIMHLLKWRCQPAARSRSWSATIDEQRLQIESVFAESPSLRPLAGGLLPQAYKIALEDRPRTRDRRARPCRRCVLPSLPFYSRRHPIRHISAGAVTAPKLPPQAGRRTLTPNEAMANQPAKWCSSERKVSSGASSGT